MARLETFLFTFFLVFLSATAHTETFSGKEKQTHLHFYLHDTISGSKPTAVQVAQPNTTIGFSSATPFGTVFVIDDLITSSPDLTTVVGNAQGMYASTGMDKLSLIMMIDFGFTTGEYNGSSFSVMSRNPVGDDGEREVAVVGGRGMFRFGRGFAKLKTYSFNTTNGDAVIEYDVTILHH